MPFIARKVRRSLWERPQWCGDADIGADALVNLATEDNALSFWKFSGGRDELERGPVLAIASGFKDVDALDVAWLDIGVLVDLGIELRDTAGHTRVPSLVNTHVDAVELDQNKIARLAQAFADAIHAENKWQRFSQDEVRDILRGAVKSRLVAKEQLQEKLRKNLA